MGLYSPTYAGFLSHYSTLGVLDDPCPILICEKFNQNNTHRQLSRLDNDKYDFRIERALLAELATASDKLQIYTPDVLFGGTLLSDIASKSIAMYPQMG